MGNEIGNALGGIGQAFDRMGQNERENRAAIEGMNRAEQQQRSCEAVNGAANALRQAGAGREADRLIVDSAAVCRDNRGPASQLGLPPMGPPPASAPRPEIMAMGGTD